VRLKTAENFAESHPFRSAQHKEGNSKIAQPNLESLRSRQSHPFRQPSPRLRLGRPGRRGGVRTQFERSAATQPARSAAPKGRGKAESIPPLPQRSKEGHLPTRSPDGQPERQSHPFRQICEADQETSCGMKNEVRLPARSASQKVRSTSLAEPAAGRIIPPLPSLRGRASKKRSHSRKARHEPG